MEVRNDDDSDETVGIEAANLERYTDIRLENGEVVIYDVDDENAWIQAASAVPLETMA
jgi:hypothetical protein